MRGGAQAVLGGWLRRAAGRRSPVAVGHRVVHGGPDYAAPVLVDDARAGPARGAGAAGAAAPAEQPGADPRDPRAPARTAAGRLLRHRLPPRPSRGRRPLRHPGRALPARACAATASTACPTSTSPRACPRSRPSSRDGRVVVAHLGSGASMCAIQAGRSVDSTMGFTAARRPADGHAARPARPRRGALPDAARKGCDRRAIERFLYHDCGLKGLSGVSNDMRDLLASDDPRRRAGARLLRLPHRAARSARWRPPWAGSTASCSPPASARTRPPIRGGDRRAPAPGSASSSTRRANARTAPLHLHRRRAGSGLRRPDRRGADDRPPHAAAAAATLTGAAVQPIPETARHDRSSHRQLRGPQGPGHRHRQRPVDRLGLRQGLPRPRRRARRHLPQREGASRTSSRWPSELEAPIVHAARLCARGPARGGVRAHRAATGAGSTSLLHSIAFAPKDDLHGRVVDCSKAGFLQRHGGLLLVLHPHGQARRAADGPTAARCSA